MNKKVLKTSLTLASIAAVAAPIATVVACGSSSTAISDKIIIKYTWAANGKAVKALQTIVDQYNNNVARSGDLKVELVHVEGGYGAAVDLDIKDIKNHNMTSVANLVIDYPDSAGKLSDFALDFSKLNDSESLWEHIEGGKEGNFVTNIVEGHQPGAFSVPLSKSTGMTSIDVPVISYLIHKGFAEIDKDDNGNKLKQ